MNDEELRAYIDGYLDVAYEGFFSDDDDDDVEDKVQRYRKNAREQGMSDYDIDMGVDRIRRRDRRAKRKKRLLLGLGALGVAGGAYALSKGNTKRKLKNNEEEAEKAKEFSKQYRLTDKQLKDLEEKKKQITNKKENDMTVGEIKELKEIEGLIKQHKLTYSDEEIDKIKNDKDSEIKDRSISRKVDKFVKKGKKTTKKTLRGIADLFSDKKKKKDDDNEDFFGEINALEGLNMSIQDDPLLEYILENYSFIDENEIVSNTDNDVDDTDEDINLEDYELPDIDEDDDL